jgi:hypothetical protein
MQEINNLNGAYYIAHFIDNVDELMQQCKQYMNEHLDKCYRILGYPNNGPLVITMQQQERPSFIEQQIVQHIIDEFKLSLPIFQTSMNYYEEDTCLSPHRDSKGQQVFIISLSESTYVMDFWKLNDSNHYTILTSHDDYSQQDQIDLIRELFGEPSVSVPLEPGSCLLMSGDSFSKYVHGIQCKEHVQCRQERISILCWS